MQGINKAVDPDLVWSGLDQGAAFAVLSHLCAQGAFNSCLGMLPNLLDKDRFKAGWDAAALQLQ
jgi:hypothetical protein